MLRVVKFVLAFVLTVVATVSLSTVSVQAASRPASSVSIHRDLTHPMKETYPCAGTGHSGVARFNQALTFKCSTNKGKGPEANDQSGNCYNGITYLQGFTNVPGYDPSTVVKTFVSQAPYSNSYWFLNSSFSPNLRATVEYFWCPAANGTKYPNGVNYARGTFYYTTGCGPVYIYDSVDLSMYSKEKAGDGEAVTYSSVCSTTYIYDYSNIADGTYQYVAGAQMLTYPGGSPGVVAVGIGTPRAQ